ncbi:hypothetical protein [Yeosuana sp.]|uniref:hypothetical protein n=1 Tax=Yeosuana sp. TaxID=2529388 RepID=UPI00404A02B6
MKKIIVVLMILVSIVNNAQTEKKAKIFAEFGLGFGQTLFSGDIKENLQLAYGGTFDPGTGNNLIVGFHYAPDSWKGFGLGSRIKGTFGSSVTGTNNENYIFNYYNLGLSGKYYFLSKEFNKGLYSRAGLGFGQFTSKRENEAQKLYKHQYGIGSTLTAGLGWTFPLKKMAISVEAEYEYSSRNGTIDGIGDKSFTSGQIGGNVILSF